MLKIFGLIALGLALVVTALLLIASRRPDSARFARSIRIRATPERLFPLINDLRAMNTWNPYANRDPGMQASYSGPAAGPGATYTFEGKKSGTGHIAITQSDAARRVALRLLMTKPMACDNAVEFTLVPHGDETEVTWAMSGAVPFMAKVMHTVLNVDKMLAKDFDEGLAALKAIAEKA